MTTGLLDRETFIAKLREVGGRAYHDKHPFHVAMNEGRLSPDGLRGWVANRFYYQRNIPIKDAAILSNCPLREVRRVWIHRIVDHDGSSENKGGIEAWLRLGKACGLARDELMQDRHLLPGVRVAVDGYVNLVRTQPWPVAIASSLTELFAPDLMAIAKGLGGGYQPVGAVLLSGQIFDAFSKGSGFFQHGHTYMGHPMAAAAGLAVQDVIRRDGLLANVVAMGDYLQRRLEERFANHHHVGDIRGRGLFRGVELVSDCASKQPFAPELKVNALIKREAMARGLMVYPMGGTIDGVRGDHVLLAPPFIVNREQVDMIVERLGDAVDAAVASVR